ncbi:hypothetical protein EHQ05_17610 [Leptospira yasudae]|uniref:hypothetical protein n=1 Tax=Leptospira yasudae TaxID=2202201 RepID=UPI001082C031|nr:hypothetical protein [Leptospira yasudae]TGK24713.1 hypothetical protein EHQ05_17610 [Leptospira yasudae]TGM09402.1 hypothetical protein EHQ86_01865 [Leptospira yasudae]
MKRNLYFIFSILLILFGVISAYQMRWIGDDAFISLRYAKNFADGKGLVFNEGEYVEGYTNFLWTVLLIPFHWKEWIHPVNATYCFGIASFLGTCIYLLLFSRRISKDNLPIPFALSCYVFLHHNRVFATGGLETSLHGFIFIASSYHLIHSQRIISYRTILGIGLSVLSCLNRPDGLLFHALAGIYVALRFFHELQEKQVGLKSRLLRFKSAFLLFLYASPIFFYIWKLEYYGNLLPNTFYAKSGGSAYLSQGLLYLWMFLKMYYAMVPIALFSLFSFVRTLREQALKPFANRDFRWILLACFPILYAGYYTWIGGDFMFSRFYLPILPLVFVWTEQEIQFVLDHFPKKEKLVLIILCAIPILLGLRWNLYKGSAFPIIDGITDENQIYKRETTERVRDRLLPWRKHFEDSKVRVAFAGAGCILVYYLNPVVAIETEAGLTDPVIARMESKDRKRIAHGKSAPLDYLQERGVHILLYSNGLPIKKGYDEFSTGDFSAPWRILFYSSSVMNELLKISSFQAVDFPSYLDSYRYEYLNLTVSKRSEKFSEFESYYFRNGQDPKREEWFRKNR